MYAPLPSLNDRERGTRVFASALRREVPPSAGRRDEQSLCSDCLRTCGEAIRRVGSFYALRSIDLDDFMQDAWLAVLRSLDGGKFDPRRGRLADWLHVVARNRAVTFFRRRWREQNGVVAMPLDRLPCHASEDPAAIVARAADIERVRQALRVLEQRISPICYAVFRLRRIEQCTVAEVADTLRLSSEQVRAYDYRARRKLASVMRNEQIHS